ncbi:MAG TPA: DUF2520 domain-containing protein [Bacteroidales bacterium]|nr:DUF2520 domain-containing protein [Bacteroidales bacterium]
MIINDIVIIGAGNVATNMAAAFRNSGKNIRCVFSRNAEKARSLASLVDAPYTNKIAQLPRKADLFLIAVKDNAIDEVADQLSDVSGIVVHTSGSVGISVFENKLQDYGILYPLMHLSKEILMDFEQIPLCIEANTPLNYDALYEFACAISHSVYPVTSAERKILHLSAVFASNFTNLNYIISEDILKKNNLSFNMLRPIIVETATKILRNSPSELQTGPAVREDQQVLGEHENMLNDFPQYQKIYTLLSELIIQKKKNNELQRDTEGHQHDDL